METARHSEIVEALLRPEAYPDDVGPVELVETHISHLFLTSSHVYKVKKPVDYGFLDFTTLADRKYYCEREVALNRRIAPDVYLGVVEIRRQGSRYAVDGPGETVEYAVKMRRLPHDRSLDGLLDQDQVSHDDIRHLATLVANFHADAATGPEITRLGSIEAVRQNVEENFAQTERFVGMTIPSDTFDDIAAYSRAFLDTNEAIFRRRAADGRVRDCHGDLHSAQIFLESSPTGETANKISIIDCIEFTDRFRYSDVAEDIAFLAMDLDFHGRPDLSQLFVETYAEVSGDAGVHGLLGFFKGYRAYVRGKVSSFRLDDTSLSEEARRDISGTARAYFKLAHDYARVFPQPALIVVAGLPGTGKSSVAEELARRWDVAYISSDITRKALAGAGPTEHQYSSFETGIYEPTFSRSTYNAMFDQAKQHLLAGRSVVLDATFRRAEERRRATEMARECDASAWIVEMVLDDSTVKTRLEERVLRGDSTSDARWATYQQQKKEWEQVSEAPPGRHIRLDASGTQSETVKQLLYRLYLSVLNEAGQCTDNSP